MITPFFSGEKMIINFIITHKNRDYDLLSQRCKDLELLLLNLKSKS